jgi:hypothetical protein
VVVETPAYQRSSGASARVACRRLLVFVHGDSGATTRWRCREAPVRVRGHARSSARRVRSTSP